MHLSLCTDLLAKELFPSQRVIESMSAQGVRSGKEERTKKEEEREVENLLEKTYFIISKRRLSEKEEKANKLQD